MAAHHGCVNALTCAELSPLGFASVAQEFDRRTVCRTFGAGEGNRTLVVSLEGFCSTIELHPLGEWPMPLRPRMRQPISRLTEPKRLPYHANRMTNLIALAACSNARLWWWRDCTLAARWRD